MMEKMKQKFYSNLHTLQTNQDCEPKFYKKYYGIDLFFGVSLE